MTSLVYFTVTGDWRSDEDPETSSSANTPELMVLTGFVNFRARLPSGYAAYVADFDVEGDGAPLRPTAIAFAERKARIWEGRLSTINVVDSPDVKLLANMPQMNLAADGITDLIYDVSFDKVVGGKKRLLNFAFKAPATAATICITDPALERLPWQKP